MASIGAHLRELRTRRGVSLDELARTTRVASRYLEALERDAFNDLPAPVFIRGFIRAYCQALGESPNEALACYDGQDGRIPSTLAQPAPPPRASGGESRPRGAIVVSFVLLVILGMALFTVALVIRPGDRAERSVEARPPTPAIPGNDAARSGPVAPPPPSPAPPAAPGPSAAPAPSSTTAPPAVAPAPVTVRSPAAARPATPTNPPGPPPVAARPAVPAVAPAPPPDATSAPSAARTTTPAAPAATPVPSIDVALGSVSAPYRLVARTSEPTWIRVRTEDGRTSEETVPAGEIREWVSDRPFVLTVGNAGGVSLELNGRTLPPLGPRGVVVPRLVVPPDAR
jgi:cytoskeleton protein RodZ